MGRYSLTEIFVRCALGFGSLAEIEAIARSARAIDIRVPCQGHPTVSGIR